MLINLLIRKLAVTFYEVLLKVQVSKVHSINRLKGNMKKEVLDGIYMRKNQN